MHEMFSLVFLTSLHTESSFPAIVTAPQEKKTQPSNNNNNIHQFPASLWQKRTVEL